jgi:hypothetical protein
MGDRKTTSNEVQNISLATDTFKTANDSNINTSNGKNGNTSIDKIPSKLSSGSDTNQNIIIDFKKQTEFIIFKNQIDAMVKNNLYILKECKESKRLLDLKYDALNNYINYIQISVIFLSTISGFLESTKTYFDTPTTAVSISGVTISTYISLILSVSKYFKFDESKERIHNLREKYSNLHNKLEYRMDVLGPWLNETLWEHQDCQVKLKEWNDNIVVVMDEEYLSLIETKQALCTEFEIIMDSKSRNEYNIKNKRLIHNNRRQLFQTIKDDWQLEQEFKKSDIPLDFKSSIALPDDDLNNWDDPL